jgi:hypothetical protein
MRLKRVGLMNLALTLGVMYAVFGFIFGLFFALFAMVGAGFAQLAGEESGVGGPIFGLLFGVGAVIFLPVFYGVLGFLGGLLMGGLYNVVSKLTGGIELTLE